MVIYVLSKSGVRQNEMIDDAFNSENIIGNNRSQSSTSLPFLAFYSSKRIHFRVSQPPK